jgi:hypothetical protein
MVAEQINDISRTLMGKKAAMVITSPPRKGINDFCRQP